ncbi:LysR family transcriptional regulator [Pigmentiphaga aceris]|uniref:LysR family transcriptional regulator n=1 Tax=Pigmentiphaga aceris TaxID=1940612 RepID=A0A5C0AR55_9BURK|nr:LysR family transcriptional regulator [Pigmentiphaga aceris]QEI04582.1 LysR family transcriptional regulator [Pigmentiphaga aceris]
MIKLDDIAIFVHVVRAGGLAAAARRLGMPANTISRRLRELETAVGTPLLLRSSRYLHCTAAGDVFFSRCQDSVDVLELASRDLHSSGCQIRGEVRVAMSSSFSEFAGPGFFNDFLDTNPQVRVQFMIIDQEPRLVDNGIDLALRLGPIDKPSKVVRKLGRVTLGLYASEAYIAAYGQPCHISDLRAHRHIRYLDPRHNENWVIKGPDGEHPLRMDGQFASDSTMGMIHAAEAGRGIALISTQAMRHGRHALVRVLPDYHVVTDGFYAVYPAHGTLSAAARALLDFVIQATALLDQAAGDA